MSATTSFIPQSGAMAIRASERHIERMAPERDAMRRSRSLATLGFSDRVIGPYVSRAQQSPLRMFGSADAPVEAGDDPGNEIESTSWVFPRPWYLDEIGWLQSTRAGAMESEGRAARGARAAAVHSAAARAPRSAAGPVGRMAVSPSALPALDLIAPSFAAAGQSSGRAVALAGAWRARGPELAAPVTVTTAPGSTRALVALPTPARPTALRAWSPLVPFAAVQAAELMAGVLTPAGRAGDAPSASDASDSAPWQAAPAQELVAPWVAPRDLVAPSRADVRREPAADRSAPVPEALRNRLQNALRRLEAQRAQTQTGRVSGQAAPAATATSPSRSDARVAAAESRSAARAAVGSTASSAAASSATAPSAAAPTGPAATAPATAPASASSRALELMLRSAVAGRTSRDMAPSSGPRLALPAGLGGLIAGMRAERAVSRPASSRVALPRAAFATSAASLAPAVATEAPAGAAAAQAMAQATAAELPLAAAVPGPARAGQVAPAGLAYGSAYRAVTQMRPTALAHVAWTDRWLARFAGASTETLTALAMTTGTAASAPARAAFAAQAPETVFLSGLLGERATSARAASPGAGVVPAPQAGRAAPGGVQAQSAAIAARPQSASVSRPAPVSAPAPATATPPSAPRIADDD
ncbi:MAG TPA: hypothetical protein VNM90_17680, partial [Haliangium sp.]|nr:hypothetical protein [Haliangium sp.]